MSSDTQARRALGNGKMLAYVSGVDVRELFGPVYSSPQSCTVRWARPVAREWSDRPGLQRAELVDGSAIGVHVVGESAVVRFDYSTVDPEPLRVEIAPVDAESGWGFVPGVSWLHEIPIGAPVYIYPSEAPLYVCLAGDVRLREKNTFEVDGHGSFVLSVGRTLEDAINDAHRALAQTAIDSAASAEDRTLRSLEELSPFAADNSRIDWRSAAEQIVVQQSVEGGFVAGHNYALAYLRDQFGVCEGLLALGLFSSVKRNILFRLQKWQEFGDLANAEGMGAGTRHRHENDDVEQTAYMILQVLRYADASGDRRILVDCAELIRWCLARQHEWLHEGTLPFNGDETYVAGGIVPRWVLEDGSIEATTLYAAALAGVLDSEELLLLPGEREQFAGDLEEIGRFFARNFLRADDRLVTNSVRRRGGDQRATRRGVCESCERYIVDTIRLSHGRYVCARCVGEQIDPLPTVEFSVPSATLVSFLVPSPVPERPDAARSAHRVLDDWLASHLEGSPRDVLETGFEAGLLLRAAVALSHPAASALADHVASLADRYSTWAEFYRDQRPVNTRCRPWESGMNIAALRQFNDSQERRTLS